MGWIKERILAEHRKHNDLDWAGIAEKKIISTYTELENRQIEFLCERFNDCLILHDYDGINKIYKELVSLTKDKLRIYHNNSV